MKILAKGTAAALLLLFAAGAAFAGPPGPPGGPGRFPMGPGPVRMNNSMPIMHSPGGPGGPGGPGPGGAFHPGPGPVRGPMMGPPGGPPPGPPRPPMPNVVGPGFIGRPMPYRGPYPYEERRHGDNGANIALGVIGGLILGGILSNNAN